MNKRIRKKLWKRKFPLLDPGHRLDWQDKQILAFSAKSNAEAAWFFEKLIDHTMASESIDDRNNAAFTELGRLRLCARNGLGNSNVDIEHIMGFVYTRYIRPMSKRYGIKLDNSNYDLHTPKNLIYVPVPQLILP